MESKKDTNELSYKTEIDPQTYRTDVMLPRGNQGKGAKDWEFGLSRCKL